MLEPPVKKQALLIGINDYDVLPKLKYARQDAEAVSLSLRSNYCFSDNEVTILTDAREGIFIPSNRVRILSQLDNLSNQDLDLFIFGFWGHGVVRNGKRYLCPKDVSSDEVEQLGVPFDDLMSKLTKIRAKNTCLILDCCQSVHDGERGEVETLTPADQKTIENAARDIVLRRKGNEPEFVSNVAILNSCKQGQAAYEWDNRKHGIFTAHLLDAMNRRYDTVSKIVSYVSKNVEKTANDLGKKQTPLCSLEGDIQLPVDTKSAPLVTGDVFISYRHSNEKLVTPIEEELKKRDISYFIDRIGVNYAMDYSEALAQAVEECKVLLFVWTQDADVSHDILREVSLAFAHNKKVLPYKIGTFDIKEHKSLFYQLSPISRYEVPKQTPETITELVNQVQRALTEEYQQYRFDITEKSADAVIVKPEIGNINITIKPRIIDQQQPIMYNKLKLPPKSKDLLRIPAENKELQEAIEQLKSLTHESLAQANNAFRQTEAQLMLWKKRCAERWKDLPQNIQNSWKRAIVYNPDCTENDIDLRKTWENMIADKSNNNSLSKNQLYFDLLEKFECGKKYQQAKLEFERVKRERLIKCNEAIDKFHKQIEANKHRYDICLNNFLDEVLLTILSAMPGYKDVNAPFPANDIIGSLRQLDKYELGWDAPDETDRARKLWNEKRPCVIAKNQQRRAEEEKKQRQHDAKILAEKKKQEMKILLDRWGNNAIYVILFLIEIGIGIFFLYLCGYLYANTNYVIPSLYYLYVFGSIGSFLIGMPLTISAIFYCFGYYDMIQISIRCYYLLSGIAILALGGLYCYEESYIGGIILLLIGLSAFKSLGYLFDYNSFSLNEEDEIRSLSMLPLLIGGGIILWNFDYWSPDMANFKFTLALASVFLGILIIIIPYSSFNTK